MKIILKEMRDEKKVRNKKDEDNFLKVNGSEMRSSKLINLL